jgi:hypothetical protein
VAEHRPAHELALVLTLATGHRRQPQLHRRQHGVRRRTERDLNLATPIILFRTVPFLSLVSHLDLANLAVGLVV